MDEALNTGLAGLITRMADDELVLGHRNSEWTGLGPILEEDIAFSSMAQDKIGHALALYQVLERELGGTDPDHFAFFRDAGQYQCCHFVEYPNREYDFSLMRHFLFDAAETVRFASLEESTFQPFRQLARKFRGELKYHMMHARAWIHQLGHGGEAARERMQSCLSSCFGSSLGIFEEGIGDDTLISSGIFPGEKALREKWLELVEPLLEAAAFQMPSVAETGPDTGGRTGIHTSFLQPLLDEMREVFRMDPAASW